MLHVCTLFCTAARRVATWLNRFFLPRPAPCHGRVITIFFLQSQLVDIEEKRTSVKTLFSFSERKRNAVDDSQLQEFERRWNRLWLNFAEWKCLLEVALDQHGKVRLNSNTDQYKASVQTTKFTFPDSQSGSSDSSNSPVLVKRAASVSYSSSTAANNFLSLFPTNRR